MGDFSMRVDLARNRLYLTLSGLFSDEETRSAADQCIEGAKQLRPGFHVINDISAFRPLTKEGVAHVKRAGEFCAKSGMKASVRIVGISPTALQQFQRVAKEGNYTAYTAQSVDEAEAMLDAHRD
jgi:hypothetical protein